MDNLLGSSLAEGPPASDTEDRSLSHAYNDLDQTQADTSRLSQHSTKDHKAKSQRTKQICRYFATKKGCRAADQCRYQHLGPAGIASPAGGGNAPASVKQQEILGDTTVADDSPLRQEPHRAAGTPSSQPSKKPISQAELENPREFQISQVVRRYKPFRADLGDTTTLKFRLDPTDPDFPFELEGGLQCILSIPVTYPTAGKPTLGVQNVEMARGFQINVEKGFDGLITRSSGKSLLASLNELDRNLEQFLTSTKATTVKFVANKRFEPPPSSRPESQQLYNPSAFPILNRYSDQQRREAKIRRDAELRQLEARLGRSELFSKMEDGMAYNVPLQIADHTKLSASLRSLRDTALIVPDVYPLEPCTIILKDVEGTEAENVEVAFENRCVEKPELSLMAHINYLTQNLGKLAVNSHSSLIAAGVVEEEDGIAALDSSKAQDETPSEAVTRDPSRPHLRFVPRPPEWNTTKKSISSDDSDISEYDSEEESEVDDEDTSGGTQLSEVHTTPEKGIQISLPGLDLSSVELLQISRLSISVKCERCKEQTDVKNLVAGSTYSESCQRCGATHVVSYRPDLIHINSTRAGHIDMENCSVVDLLPSTFQPTCSACSTIFPDPPGVVAVRGDTKLTICRSCHTKMIFAVPDVKFLRVSTASSTENLPLRSRKPKENLGISAGTPLANNGRCQHYSRSYRWFRFSCCNRVFPCDKCHDTPSINPSQKENAHPNEHADRMICGWCSREQRYHPDTCRMCGNSVVKKVITTGFWEGGKGTRDKNLMRKKEGRKYKVSGKEKKELDATKKRKDMKGRGGMWWPGE